MDLGDTPGTIRVEIVFSPSAGYVQRLTLDLPGGATVAQALAHSGWALPAELRVGVWGRPCGLGDALRDRDRVEIYRPLRVEPKEARRQRYLSQRAATKS
jgi:putative ubiquitin-RnfH superfamily antitoxin RatB of RatAB toxin-antitoxin module